MNKGNSRKTVVVTASLALVALAAVVAFRLNSDSDAQSLALSANAKVIYQFHDSSVAPEYHRSYTLTLTKGSAHLAVDSYGDIVTEASKDLDDATWQAIRTKTQRLATAQSSTVEGCAGGTSDEIAAYNGGVAEVLHVTVDNCGGASGVDVKTPVADALALFDLKTMLATG